MNPRLLSGLAAAMSLALTMSACSSDSGDSASTSFTFAGFGGALQESQTKAWFEPYEDESAVKINQTTNTGIAALQTQIESGNVLWDVVDESLYVADSGCGTIYEKIPDVDRSAVDPESITNECGVPIVKFSFVLAYNSKAFPTAPTSIEDLLNVEDFPGKRAVSNVPVNGPVEAALMADGVAPDELYPIDFNRAIDKLREIKDDLVFEEDFAVVQEALASGNLNMAVLPNGRAYEANKLNPDIKVAWGGAVTRYDNALVVKGSPNAELGKKFLSYLAKPATQAALAEILPYGVLTTETPSELPADVEAFFPDNPEYADDLLYQDQNWWGDNQDAVNEAWTSFISG